MDNYIRLIKTRPLNAAATRAGAPATPKPEVLLFHLSRLWHERIEDAAAFVGGLLFAAVAAWVGPSSVRAIYRQEVSKHWPTAPGTIVYVESRTAGHVPFSRLKYRYEVNGYPHEGETDDLPHYTYRQLKEMFERRKAVSVHYSPEDPGVSVFDPGLSLRKVFSLFGSLGCLGYAWKYAVPLLRRLGILKLPTAQHPRLGPRIDV